MKYTNPPCSRAFAIVFTLFLVLLGGLARRAEADEKITIERDVEVPMRDGTILRANVFRPSSGGPFPVLISRTPYGKSANPRTTLVNAGYIVVTQDARGRYASDGQFESFVRADTHDGSDGFDTVEWAAKLPNSTGEVGLLGTSYPGFLAWRAAGAQPTALKAMAAFSIPARYLDLEGPGTIRPGRRLKWWHGTMSPDLRLKADGPLPHSRTEAAELWNAGEGETLLYTLPWSELPNDIFGSEASTARHWLANPWEDPWQLDKDAAKTLVPNLNVCGWYDHCNGSIDLHTAIASNGGSDEARASSRLIVGPWSHSGLGRRKQGDIDFGPDATVDLNQLYLDWFGYWIRGEKNDVPSWSPVRIFVMGINKWRNYHHWPPTETKPGEWYFDSDGLANKPSGNGRLAREKPSDASHDHYEYDPTNPVPTLWTPSLFTIPADQSKLKDRDDILVYQSELLEEFVETIGYPEVVLHAASSCPDTDFFVRLIDVDPNGRAIDVTSGMVRARYRNNPAGDASPDPEFLKPGQVTEFRIRMRPTAHRFLEGHRIRLDVTSSDFPNYDRNHNTSADQNRDGDLVVARQTVHHGPESLSRLILPVMHADENSGGR